LDSLNNRDSQDYLDEILFLLVMVMVLACWEPVEKVSGVGTEANPDSMRWSGPLNKGYLKMFENDARVSADPTRWSGPQNVG
jgi:hypothetical protein